MKRNFLLVLALSTFSLFVSAQKMPTITIMPSDNWCYTHYYVKTYKDQGQTVTVSDFPAAFQQDPELSSMISKIGQIMTDYGLNVKDAEREMNSIAVRQGEDAATMSKTTGAMLAESDLDVIKKRTKCDILIQINWHIINKNSLDLTIEAFDAYTNKRIATSSNTSPLVDRSAIITATQILRAHITPFISQLSGFYNDINRNGREIILWIKRFDDAEQDLETIISGESIQDIVDNWLHENTVGDSFNLTDATEDFAQYEQVRIPIQDEKGRNMSARDFANQLRKYLSAKGIQTKISTRGLGEAALILGAQ